MSDSATIVQKLWNYCNVVRDDGLSYQDYIEQLTFLLFLKMADEQTRAPFSRPAIVPYGLDWASLVRLDGDDLEVQYRHMLAALGRQPGTLGVWMDHLGLAPGMRVLHVGAGLGYYTAVMAECVGPDGRVVAYEVDDALARAAHRNLAGYPQVDVRHADASAPVGGPFDAVLVNAGVTHPLDTWLDAIAPGGRLMLPITAAMPAMGPTLGKGVVVLVTHGDDRELTARIVTVVAVYSAEGVRDPAMNDAVGKALMAGPARWQSVNRLRRDAHEPAPSCWLHRGSCCFSAM